MANDDTTDPYTSPSPYQSPYAPPAPPVTATREQVEGMTQRYRDQMRDYDKQAADVQAAQKLNTDQMTKMLDATAARIKESRQGRANLPLIALGAGMMGPGDFGTQVGRGLRNMVPAIQADRQEEDQTEYKLADLGLKKGAIEAGPLKDRLDYIRALQTGNLTTIRALEQAGIRAQGTGSQTAKLETEAQKMKAGVVAKATDAAAKQFAELNKDNDYTAEEAQAVYRDLFKRNLTASAAGSGIQLNDDEINKAINMPISQVGTSTNAFPKLDDMKTEGANAGLPEMPRTYETMGPKDRSKERAKQADAYRTEAKNWDDAASMDKTNDDRLREAKMIIQQHPDLLGIVAGQGWNVSPEAVRLKTILTQLELYNVPKGQGQVTDFERKLFQQAGVMMTNNPQAAMQTIDRMREANNRSAEQRQFMDNYYQTYKTLDGARSKWEQYVRSPAASYVTEQNGQLVANPDRMPSNIFFKWQRAGQPEIRRTPDGQWVMRKDGKVEVLQ